tara:strand:- start:20353 stop:20895 length:543 start_codon:yes stop_codon:yes gene_type:complete
MANLLTTVRLLLVVPVSWAFADPQLLKPELLMGFIFIAIATDYFDGKIARATHTESARGMLFDHGTDFLFVSSALAAMASVGAIHPLLPFLIIIAFSQYVLDSYFLFRHKQLRMSFLGRWNGIFYFAPLLCFSATRLEFMAALTSSLQEVTELLGWVLILSTMASIIDRGLAPFYGLSQK